MDEVARMEVVREMLDTEGWQIVEKFIKDRISDNKQRLLTCELKEIIKHRERIKAYESVFNYIQEVIEEGERELQGLPP